MTESNSLNFQDLCFHMASSLTGDAAGKPEKAIIYPVKLNSSIAIKEQDATMDWLPEEWVCFKANLWACMKEESPAIKYKECFIVSLALTVKKLP